MTKLFGSLENSEWTEKQNQRDRAAAAAERLGSGKGRDGKGNGLSHRKGAEGPQNPPSRDEEGLLS